MMRHVFFFVLAVFGFLAAPHSVFGELRFDKQLLKLPPPSGGTSSFEFRFKNESSAPVRIISIKSSCDCTTTEDTPNLIGPGEIGAIKGVFKIGDREGFQRKSIFVATDASDNAYTLTIETHIPVAATVTPRLLFWRASDGSPPKVIAVTPSEVGRATVLSAVEPTGEFDVQVTPTADGGSVTVRPRTTRTELRTELTITVQPAGAEVTRYKVFLRVSP
jgi:hypothetical protein